MRLEGSVALVTGAGSGIGRAIALDLAGRGARPILLGRSIASLAETQRLLPLPGAAWLLPLDLSDETARTAIPGHVTAMAGRLDLLVNNAGIVPAGDLTAQTDQAWRAMLELNLLAPMSLARGLLPLLEASGQGRVVNVGSMFGDIAFPYFAAYSASKFGLRGWSEGLRRELADRGVGVTYCAPRGTRTPASDGFADYVRAFRMTLDPAATVARRIVDAVQRGNRDVYPGGVERVALVFQRLFPALIDRVLRVQARRAASLHVRILSGSSINLG